MDAVSQYNESQRKEAKEFIAHMQELESQERRRHAEGRKMIADDFCLSNKQILDHKKRKS